MNFLKLIFIIILSLGMNSCSEADAKENKTKSNAFEKIDRRDKKLFTKEERIESYNKSVNKSESLKKSLSSSSNSGYSGYGSSTSKNKKLKTEQKEIKNKKPKAKVKVNLQYSAYSTN